jgi:hypothetical protein
MYSRNCVQQIFLLLGNGHGQKDTHCLVALLFKIAHFARIAGSGRRRNRKSTFRRAVRRHASATSYRHNCRHCRDAYKFCDLLTSSGDACWVGAPVASLRCRILRPGKFSIPSPEHKLLAPKDQTALQTMGDTRPAPLARRASACASSYLPLFAVPRFRELSEY